MEYLKIIKKNQLLMSLIAIFFVLTIGGFLFLKYFDTWIAAKIDFNAAYFNTDYLKSNKSVLNTDIFNNPKFKTLKINKDYRAEESISTNSNPFESYNKKNEEEPE